jgi:flagellar basal body-associated protein FliL
VEKKRDCAACPKKSIIIIIIIIIIILLLLLLLLLLLQLALQPLGGFWPAQLPLSILSRKVLQSAVASGTSNPQLGGEPGI